MVVRIDMEAIHEMMQPALHILVQEMEQADPLRKRRGWPCANLKKAMIRAGKGSRKSFSLIRLRHSLPVLREKSKNLMFLRRILVSRAATR